jgi:hypothetical protein
MNEGKKNSKERERKREREREREREGERRSVRAEGPRRDAARGFSQWGIAVVGAAIAQDNGPSEISTHSAAGSA